MQNSILLLTHRATIVQLPLNLKITLYYCFSASTCYIEFCLPSISWHSRTLESYCSFFWVWYLVRMIFPFLFRRDGHWLFSMVWLQANGDYEVEKVHSILLSLNAQWSFWRWAIYTGFYLCLFPFPTFTARGYVSELCCKPFCLWMEDPKKEKLCSWYTCVAQLP